MRNVVNSREVCHLWANQTQSRARNSTGTVFFEDDTIYSYGNHFPMGRIVEGHALLNSESYSVTTSKHQSWVRSACSHLPCIEVPNVRARGKVEHKENFEALRAQYEETLLKAARARVNAPYLLRDADRVREQANAYSALLGVPWRIRPANVEDIKARAEAQRKAAAAKARKERAKLIKAHAEVLPQWRAGEADYLPHAHRLPPALRIAPNGNDVQSSHGARCPIADALIAVRMVRTCQQAGREWARNGETIRLGSFQVDRIDADGNVKAGCHNIPASEIDYIEGALRAAGGAA